MPGETLSSEVLIKAAMVLDGTGAEPYRADVLVDTRGLIAAVHLDLNAPGALVVDGGGLCLAPGFVDLHSHSDLYSAVRPSPGPGPVGASAALVPIGDGPKLLQGCTAQTFGQDGISAAPVDDDHLEDHALLLAGLDGTIPVEAWSWRSYEEYLAVLRSVSATRTFGLVGHSTIRRNAMGYAARRAKPEELDAMRAGLAAGLAGGAVGWSSGLVYVPAAYSDTEELVALCEVAASHRKPFFVHVRSESDRVEEATDEVLEVAARTGCHLHYSHIKTAGSQNWHRAALLLSKIDAARADGVAVTADIHPYTAGSSTANVLLPPWVFERGGIAAGIERLREPAVRVRVRAQLLGDTTGWDNWFAFSGGWSGLRVASASDPGIVGRSFAEVIEAVGIADESSEAAFGVIFDMLVAERLSMTLVSFNNVEDNIARFFAQPYCSVGTDAVVNPSGHPHPRLYGTFPRVLGRYVRELGVVSLPEAVAKMTSRAAAVIGQAGRIGEIRVGLPGDLVLFDPSRVADRATFESPRLRPVGIEAVFVGGRRVVSAGDFVAGVIAPAGAPRWPLGSDGDR
ncbi:MAG: N-acyl-D-amino-acid deacylase family protein [Acidimicrobiales bacterium]